MEDGGSNWCATYGDTMEAPGSLGKSVEQLHDFAQTTHALARASVSGESKNLEDVYCAYISDVK